MCNVQLISYNESYLHELSSFSLPEDQVIFTALPLQKLNNTANSSEISHMIILADEKPVGFFSLEEGEKRDKYTTNKKAKLLTAFSINFEDQGKGFAKKSLRLLPAFLYEQFTEINEVVLGVNKRNIAAKSLYLSSGFKDLGEVYEGLKGPQHILHLTL
ncbi:GNAT family N-acetyltransferase [Bacillus weihaiensis]|uniref:GNAT family N-acetyltransferase n=1 Tax=Bacillus weihaiensis TaxID=1547283 RepID=UPI00235649A9|nr:GNAT family protein [Bacillus weihaiensis]